jgi:phosphoenolpyruvate-protein kinase (PTS system EI component)
MINSINSSDRSQAVYTKEKKSIEGNNIIQKDETAAVLELGNRKAGNVTYAKPVSGRNTNEISRLREETEKAFMSLRAIVEKLIARQGKKYQEVFSGKEELVVDETARAEAERLLAEDGELGVKAVSTRIVDFAKALSGGDKSKLPELRAAIEKGFREAERILGGLPQISRDTYDEVMRLLDEWANEE